MAGLRMVTLVVPDYDEGLAFFGGVLGWAVEEDTPLEAPKRWVVLAPGDQGARVLLARAAKPEQAARVGDQTGGRVAFFLDTDDIAADHERLTAAGVRFVREPTNEPYGTVAVFADPWGNLFDLVQRL